jgi:hypothetical protein
LFAGRPRRRSQLTAHFAIFVAGSVSVKMTRAIW